MATLKVITIRPQQGEHSLHNSWALVYIAATLCIVTQGISTDKVMLIYSDRNIPDQP